MAFLSTVFTADSEESEDFSRLAKIALREVGNQLLLSNNDSTSLVLPVIALEAYSYQLSLESAYSIEPKNLVSLIESSFEKSGLPTSYIVELIQQTDGQVAYSYKMNGSRETSIIPCFGRVLARQVYVLEVDFSSASPLLGQQAFIYVPLLVSLMMLVIPYYRRRQMTKAEVMNDGAAALGRFRFYPGQLKLYIDSSEINLSRKECELLTIFSDKPNEIISRDELMKRIWEDHGVFVGRSLDTYISKLRKILKADPTIQITNIRGVGYKMEL